MATTSQPTSHQHSHRPFSPARRRLVHNGERGNNAGGTLHGFGGWRFVLRWNGEDIGNETVAHARDCLHKAGLLGIVAKHLADFANGGVDAMFGVDKYLTVPEPSGNFIAPDEVAVSRHQQNQKLHRLPLQADRTAIAGEFKARAIQPEFAELVSDNRQRGTIRGRKYTIGLFSYSPDDCGSCAPPDRWLQPRAEYTHTCPFASMQAVRTASD